MATLCPARFCLSVAKRGNIVARRADTRNVCEDFQKHFFASRTQNSCRPQMLRAWQNESTFGKHAVTSAMLPPQCVLVLPALFTLLNMSTAIPQTRLSECVLSTWERFSIFRWKRRTFTRYFPYIGHFGATQARTFHCLSHVLNPPKTTQRLQKKPMNF